MNTMSNQINQLYEFGEFRLDTCQNALWRQQEFVTLTPKAFEVLRLLIEKHGDVVSKEELMNKVWDDTYVEESNLTQNIYTLRRALGKHQNGHDFIETVPRRGYRFAVPIHILEASSASVEVTDGVTQTHLKNEIEKQATDTTYFSEVETDSPVPSITNSEIIEKEIRSSENLVSAPDALPKNRIRWRFIGVVLVGIFFATSFAAWWNFDNRTGLSSVSIANRNIRTIAILPLKTFGEEERSKAVSLGLTDSLISRLGGLNGFTVRPLNSVNEYLEDGKDPLKFGAELKVDAVLEGTLQTSENRLRVNVRLWDVRDGVQLWQASFDETEADLFALQDTLSARVTRSLAANMSRSDGERYQDESETVRATNNREAYHAYWRGRLHLEKRAPEKAIREFEQAIKLDSNYVLAYTGLADAQTALATLSNGNDQELYEQALQLTQKALEINPNLSEAHTSLARIKYWHDWDWNGAEKSFKRALELDSNSVNAHQFYARLLTTLGRYDEALAEIYQAREIDPRSADLAIPLAAILAKRGQFEEALKVIQTSLEMDNDSQMTQRVLGEIYLIKGDDDKVIELGNQLFPSQKKTDFAWASMLATAYRRTGQEEKADKELTYLRELAAKDPKPLYFLAMHYSEVGRADEAIIALQKCLELREERIIWTKGEPRLAALAADPRFDEILRKLKIN